MTIFLFTLKQLELKVGHQKMSLFAPFSAEFLKLGDPKTPSGCFSEQLFFCIIKIEKSSVPLADPHTCHKQCESISNCSRYFLITYFHILYITPIFFLIHSFIHSEYEVSNLDDNPIKHLDILCGLFD